MTLMKLFKAWANERSPKPSVTYINAGLSLVLNLEVIEDALLIEKWIKESSLPPSRARHALKLVLQWATSMNIPCSIMPAIKARPLFSVQQLALLKQRSNQTINRRQHFVMALLYSCTSIPPGRIPIIVISHVTLIGSPHVLLDGISYPIKNEAIVPLKYWIALRLKLAQYEKECHFYCKTEAWAKSNYLFPNHQGATADRSSIRKLLRSTAL